MQAQWSSVRKNVLDRISRILLTSPGKLLIARRIDEDTGLLGHGVGLDSIEVLTLVAALEEEFELTIDDAELNVQHFATVGALLDLVCSKVINVKSGD